MLRRQGTRTANPVIVRSKKLAHALRTDSAAGAKVEVFETVRHAQGTYNLFRYCSDKPVEYGFGIGAAAEGMRL